MPPVDSSGSLQLRRHLAAEALHRLVECYLRLGVVDEAQRYAAVLGHNFPGSVWYKDSYALMQGKTKGEDEGWLGAVGL